MSTDKKALLDELHQAVNEGEGDVYALTYCVGKGPNLK